MIRYSLLMLALLLLPAGPMAKSVGQIKERSTYQNNFLPTLGIEKVLSLSELVLVGQILGSRTHLRSDSHVVTDYSVSPLRILKQNATASTTTVPGPTRPLVVRCGGGTVVEGDTKYTTIVDVFPESEGFKAGEHVILLLVYDEQEELYKLTHGPFAAFRVAGGQVNAMTKAAAKRSGFQPRSLEPFLAELARGAK